MEPFVRLSAVAAPMELPNIDTDRIIPARFLRRPREAGYGPLLFHAWIYLDAFEPHLPEPIDRHGLPGLVIACRLRDLKAPFSSRSLRPSGPCGSPARPYRA